MTIPAYYKDGVPYDSSGQIIITIPCENPSSIPPPPLVTDLGDGKFQFKSQKKYCYLKNLNGLGVTWVMDRDDGGVAACFATKDEKRVAVGLLTGLWFPPEYLPEQLYAAQSLLDESGAFALNGGQWAMAMAVAGQGVMTLAEEIARTLASAVRSAVGLLTASSVGPATAAISTILFSPPAGEGSGRVPGRDLDALFALNARLLAGDSKFGPGTTSVELPVRGTLVWRNGMMVLDLLKTGNILSAAVPVLNAVRDAATGLDIITVPAMGGIPPRTILVNPAPVPTGPENTGSQIPVPVVPTHTGTTIKPVTDLVVTPPAGEFQEGLLDFIYWRPNAAGTGVEPVYVMLSDPLDSGPFTRKQLDKKYKHAGDFGITDTKKNRETLTQFRDAIEAHLADKDTMEKGTYLFVKESIVLFNPKTNNVVILKKKRRFCFWMEFGYK